MTVAMPSPGRSRASSRASSIGSPNRMNPPPLQVPTAACPSIGLTLLRSISVTAADAELLAGAVVGLFVLLWIDLHFFARGRGPSFVEAGRRCVACLGGSLPIAYRVRLPGGGDDAVVDTTVYL